MNAQVGYLLSAGFLFAAVAGSAGRYFLGDSAVIFCATATLLCLVPGVLTLLWARWISRNNPRQLPGVALGASGVRMFVVLACAALLYLQVPPFQGRGEFLFWVLAAYLVLLAVEVTLLVAGQPQGQPDNTNQPR